MTLPDAATRGSNENAIHGGIRLWERPAESTPAEFVDATTAAATLTVATDPFASTASAAAKTRPPRPAKRAATGAKKPAKTSAKTPAKTRTRTAATPPATRSAKKGMKKTAPGRRTRRA